MLGRIDATANQTDSTTSSSNQNLNHSAGGFVKQAVYGDAPQTPFNPPPQTSSTDNSPKLFGLPLKYVSLITLAVQNAMLTIIMHYSRVSTAPSKTYSAASAVLLNELLKGSISMFIALMRIGPEDRRSRSSTTSAPSVYNNKAEYTMLTKSKRLSSSILKPAGGLLGRFRRLGREVFSSDCWKLSIPAILYVIQNNLQFVAASNLDVATFQVTYQMKILTTAGFSVILLRKRLTTVKWLSLLGLAIGVGIVQIQTGSADSHGKPSTQAHVNIMNPLKGFLAVAAACLTSGLAGVYFEMVLKGSQSDLWVRNVQLSLFSLLPALVPVLFSNNGSSDGGWFSWLHLFKNFGAWAWATVLIQVFGGLVTAIVIKYSDNIMKGFATSLSIVISFLASVALFNFSITIPFIVGSTVVLGATWAYNQPTPESAKPVEANANPALSLRSLSSLSLSGGRRGGADSVDASDPIIGQSTPKKKSPLPTPKAIASAIKGIVSSRPPSPEEQTPFLSANYRSSSNASLSNPPSRNQSTGNLGIGMTSMENGERKY